MSENRCCETCQYWNSQQGTILTAECHRYPPVVITSGPNVWTGWPLSKKFEWCGEWLVGYGLEALAGVPERA